MKEQMNKKMYETPSTKRSLVEMEGIICASTTIENPGPDNAGIDEHKTNTDFSGDFGSGSWDTDPTKTTN